ncbi:carboxypeptidase-like regulatory domain-containing protein [Hymenobacter psoromatis]|uniref:carboxypeptidase-like regulatory domain-containing protein n=1 Tax=Hymenobacter psoromatis TaxID=1484116 RepID=UPI001CC04ED5|nr:carboxypeptidase-like regulatory domain-containing protein [Hymenobacter psoromatis]
MTQPAACIPEPCPASWAAMTPTPAGRHCAQCQTEVVDFTQKSPAEILAYLQKANGRAICGRLRTTQLAPASPPATTRTRWQGWLSALLTVSSLSALLLPKAAARVPMASNSTNYIYSSPASLPENPPLQEAPESSEALQKRIVTDSILVHGVVLDAQTHQPLPGVTVLLQGTRRYAATDAAGEFKLTVTSRGRHLTLVASWVGYQAMAKTILVKESNQKIMFLLETDTHTLGRIIVPAKPYGSFFSKLRALRWFG